MTVKYCSKIRMLYCILFAGVRNESNLGVSGGGGCGDSEKHNSTKCVTTWRGTLCDDELCQA